MNTQNKILYLFLFILVIKFIISDDTCPNGMRKMYLDEETAIDEGAARNYIPAINFYEGNGALWYRRKILLEPRFEIHLKVSIEPIDIIENSKEQNLGGFTIVISKNRNKLSSTGPSDYLGYYGFTKSFIFEFDFTKNNNDPDDSSYSFRYCDTDCSNDDTKAQKSGRLSLQRFDPTKIMNWDFRVIYIDKKLTLYSGPNEIIFSQNLDFSDILESNTAYIGFTGNMNGNRRELRAFGTFVCEDNYDISRMSGKFYVGDQELDTYTYKAGETVQYIFSFINNKGQVIPHCFKQGIWTYSFSLSLDCSASNLKIRMKDEYSLLLSMDACNVLGEHTIGISELSHGNGPEKIYTIIGGSLNQIILIGHDGVIKDINSFSILSGKTRTLKYGASDGDFPLKGESLEIVLDFEFKDSFGNNANIGRSSSEILSITGFSLANTNSATLSIRQDGNHYQLVINIVKTGTYKIVQNSYMSEEIQFVVVVGGVSTSTSYCTIFGYTSIPNLKIGEIAYYDCFFKDGKGNIMTINTFRDLNEYDFFCITKKISSSKSYSNQIINKEDFYRCEFPITESGIYEFYAYLSQKGSITQTRIKGTINKVNVISIPSTLTNAKIYDYYAKKWISIETGIIEYRNDKEGKLTSLDLMDSDSKTLMSNYKKYPEEFDVNEIKVQVYSTHDWGYSFGEFNTKIYSISGVEYIGIFNINGINSDEIFRRSSFEWTIKITFRNEEKYITLRYNSNDLKISPFIACFHELEVSKTNIDMSWNIELITEGAEQKIGKLELRTKDYNLFNYDIGKDNIRLSLEGAGNISFRIQPLSIAGVYEIYGTAYSEYYGNIIVYVNDVEITRRYTSATKPQACYLKFKEPNLFKHLGDDFKEHYYEYLGDLADGNLLYYFTILDKYENIIPKYDYHSTFADVYCLSYGSDPTKYNIQYNIEQQAFQFRDKLQFNNGKYTWVFFMRDSSCNNKYYISYDQSKAQTSVSVSISYYSLVNSNININEISYVNVFLLDGNSAFIGATNGRLEELKSYVFVKAKDIQKNENYEYQVDKITSNYAIRFKNNMIEAGTFEITAYYKINEIPCSSSKILVVSAPQFSIQNSKLQMVIDSTIDMDIQTKTTIKNTQQVPFYNLLLYTFDGVKTTFDSRATFSCAMTGQGVSLYLEVNKKTDYIQFTYKVSDRGQFEALKSGDYILTIIGNGESKNYSLYLLGDGNTDYSNDINFDWNQIYVNPIHIDGFAGKPNIINFEFRAKDGLRWNYWGFLNSFSFSNSYNLKNSEFVTQISEGYKKGQYIITVTQNIITNEEDNILTIMYDGIKVPKNVSLRINGGDFAKLILIEGPTEGNVLNSPILIFKPVDNFGNAYIFDPSVSQQYLNSLTVGKSLDGVSLTANNYLSDGLLKVQYKTTISTNVKVTSQYYLDAPINYRIKSGPIDPENSYAEMKTTNTQEAGSNYTIVIYPKDIYLNDIDDLNEEDMLKFLTYYKMIETKEQINVTNCKLQEGYSSAIDVIIRNLLEEGEGKIFYDNIECITQISYIGNIAFHVEYNKSEIECKNCIFSVIASQLKFNNTKTLYKNRNYYMDIENPNEIESKKEPIFEISFYDQFRNIITDVEFIQNLNIEVEFLGADILLCLSNYGNKKIASLCPSSNGNDNINKWQYITNGNKYNLKVKQKNIDNYILIYPINITGGYNGSSAKEDFTKTTFNPESLVIQAGNEGKTMMEIRTDENVRKNYWYPDISEKIKVEFKKDKDTCSYQINKGDLPGQYIIQVSCTKANDDNEFTIFVDSNKINSNIKLIVVSGPAYYLEIEEENKYIISGDKFTWIDSITNDDDIYFLFKLKDKFKNYIPISVIGKNQILINSETHGTNENYYKLEFKAENKDYIFSDEIKEALNIHIWNIICIESNRKYSFIYNILPGKVDIQKSSWTIDKTSYILNEVSIVLVTLVDRYGVNVRTVGGRLLEEMDKINVFTNNGKNISYNYNSITTNNNFKYLYEYKGIGNYKVSVSYNGQQIGEKIDLTVSYQTINLKKSKLYYILEDEQTENLMQSTIQTNIDNLKNCPSYKLYLYTNEEDKIALFDKKTSITGIMTYSDINSWELNVDKKDDHILFVYNECDNVFKKLPQGLYYLEISLDEELAKYPIYLMGEKFVSINRYYDITKTFVNPTYINGISGERYLVDIEFRGEDGLRWNYEVNINSITYSNSLKLDSNKLKVEKEIGDKNGRMKLYITQYITSNRNNDNIIFLKYEKKNIPQTITIHIKCNPELKELVYESGAVDGTVINPSIVKFIPKDKYGNLYTDLFNETKYPKEELEKLIEGKSAEGFKLTVNNYVSEEKYLNIQYGSKKVTKIVLTSKYNENTYIYNLWSGPIDAETSYAKIEKNENVKAGETTKLIIYPRDVFENVVTNSTDDDLSKFIVFYEVNKDNKQDITNTCNRMNFINYFDCQTVIVKSGDIELTVEYDNKNVKCSNCNLYIIPNDLDFSKTKVYNKNENKEMSKNEINTLPVTINPNFLLKFFDKYENPIIDQKEVKDLEIITQIIVTDVKLCISNNELAKLSTLCPSLKDDENTKRWVYLPNGNNYNLIVNETLKNEQLIYPIQLIGGYTDGSSWPIDVSKTYLSPTEINLVAGEEKIVFMELRTEEDNRKNYWYDKPEDNIKIEFLEEGKNCTYSLDKSDKPGQYNIKLKCYKTYNPFKANVIIEKIKVPKQLTITVISGTPHKSKLYRMTGEEITNSYLGSVSVEDQFQMINKLYDQYDNQITNINFNLALIQIKMDPINNIKNISKYHTWTITPVAQANGDIIITLKSTYSNEHIIIGAYLQLENYSIIFTPGSPYANNSELELSDTEILVGQSLKIFIIPKDKYNNLIDVNQYKETSPFQVKYINEDDTTKVIREKPDIEVKDGNNILSYHAILYIRGMTHFIGYIDINEIKCISCLIAVKSKDIYFLNYNAFRYESSKNNFEILKNGTVEKNKVEEPIYRLYPRDQYGNVIDIIPQDNLIKYNAYLASQTESTIYYFKLNNNETINQKYAEFIINDIEGEDVSYNSLVGGFYNLVFTDGINQIIYNITIIGDGKGGSNEPVDIQSTHIIEQNLKYIAGNTGYMIIELRTKNNLRKNFWEGYNFEIKSCDEKDKTFKFTQEKAGTMGVFYLTVTTEKANTYPEIEICPLEIYLNNQLIQNLNPLMEVSPDIVVRTKILEKYYKDYNSSNILLDGTTDSNYIFEILSYDKYDNLAETIQEEIGIKIIYRGGDEIPSNSEINQTTGFRKYTVAATKSGTYIITTDKSGPQGLYLPNESIFIIKPGKIDLSKTFVKEKSTPIQAGNKAGIIIQVYDKYGNEIDISNCINKFNATFIDSNNNEYLSIGSFDNILQRIIYTSNNPVIKVGNVKVTLFYEVENIIDTSNVNIEVIPGEPDPSKSILSREITKGIFTQYKNGDNFTVNINELLILNITLYDIYDNFISNIPADVNIIDPKISGNYMNEIKFTVNKLTSYFELDFNNNKEYIHIYQHLVKGTYDLTYKVKTELGEKSFKYYIIINIGDEIHGNGPYYIEKCILTPKNTSFIAGNYKEFALELRTKQGLLYNDDIDIENDVLVKVLKKDDSFEAIISKTGNDYGIFTITIYSEKKGENIMNILLTDENSEEKKKKDVGPVFYTVYPDKVPYKNFTIESHKNKIFVEELIEITFTLFDRFGNKFENRYDIIDNNYLTLLNYRQPLSVISISALDKEKFKIITYPEYPPNKMILNIQYDDGESIVDCLLEDINITINSVIDYHQTRIISSNKERISTGEFLDMWLYTFDKKGECFDDDTDYFNEYQIIVTGPLDSINQFITEYSVKKTSNRKDEEICDNEYKIVTKEENRYKYAGNYIIKVIVGGNLIAKYEQICIPLGYSNFFLSYDFDPNHISVLYRPLFKLTGVDQYKNKVSDKLYDDIIVELTKENITFNESEFLIEKYEITPGELIYNIEVLKTGAYQLNIYYKGKEIKEVNDSQKLPIFIFEPGPCYAENNSNFELLNELDGIISQKPVGFKFQCYDKFDNIITKGGENLIAKGNVMIDTESLDLSTLEIEDNNDGSYSVTFIPDMEGIYLIRLFNNEEKYGEDISIEYTRKTCKGLTPILCPNNNCAKNYIDCIDPPNGCNSSTPFKCKVNKVEICTKSQIDCDCPEGYIKCTYMNYCVPEEREDMCPLFLPRNCPKNKRPGVLFKDGICRAKTSKAPSQMVCPIGYILCPDLTCQKDYSECLLSPKLPNGKTRCVNQKIVDFANNCPSTITCSNSDHVVCPDGSCVENEILCPPISECPSYIPYRCYNNLCTLNSEMCGENIACGDFQSFCYDNTCRTNC